MTPTQRAAAERLAAYHAEQADHFSPFGSGNALTIFHGEAAALLRELLAEPQGKPAMRRATREEKIARPGVYEVPAQEPCGYDETTGLCTKNPCCKAEPGQEPGVEYKRGYEEALNDCIRNGVGWARSMFADNAEHIKPAEPQDEPVAWMSTYPGRPLFVTHAAHEHPQSTVVRESYTIPLYAAPQQRKPLTDEQIDAVHEQAFRELVATGWNGGMCGEQWDHAAARAIERAITGEPT